MESAIRAIIADDHQIVRQGLRQMLAEFSARSGRRVEVVAEATDGLEAIRCAKALQPDLLLLDVAMPYARGIEVFSEVRRWSPATRIVAFTGLTASGLLKALHDAGIDGIFLKGSDPEQLIDALPELLLGTPQRDAEVQALIDRSESEVELTPRELEVLSLILAGQSNAEVAGRLSISANTVKNHRASIMNKFGVHSMAELIAHALREGLLDSYRQS